MALFKKGLIEEKKTRFQIEPTPEIPTLPEIENEKDLDVKYPLISPYAYAHIFYDSKENELIYAVEEPSLTDEEKKTLKILEEGISELVNISTINLKTTETIIEYLEKNVSILLNELGIKISDETFLKIMYYLYRDFVGLNEIEPLLKDYFIEDIECNGVKTPVYIVHRKYRNLKTNIIYNELNELTSFVEKLAQKSGKYISYANPLLDAQLPDGSVDHNEPFIYKEDGIVKVSKIGEVVDKYYKKSETNIPKNVDGIEIPAFDSNLKIKWRRLNYVYRHKINEKIYELKLEAGRKVRLTGTHSIFVLKKDSIRPEKVSNLKNGDYVIVPGNLPENDVLKEFNLAKELYNSKFYKKILIEGVPLSVFKEKEREIREYYKLNYKYTNQTYYEHRNKRILPIRLYYLLPEDILRTCKLKTTSSVKIPTFLKVSKELMVLLGYYIAEGWISNCGAHYIIDFCLNKKENEYINEINCCFKKCFSNEVYLEPVYKNARKLRIDSLLIWAIFKEVLKVSSFATKKEVPEIVFNVNKELQEEFIRAWHNGDWGSTASKKLATDISYLGLFDKNIVPFYDRYRDSSVEERKTITHEFYSNFYRRKVSDFHRMIPMELFNPLNKVHWKFENKRLRRSRLKEILNEIRFKRFGNLDSITNKKFLLEWSKRGFIKFIDKAPLLTKKGQEAMCELNFIKRLIDSDLCFLKINKIEKVDSSSEFVYDVSVPSCENFVAGFGGICCHNSRVNATYTQEISAHGPSFTIRKFTKEPWTPIKLIDLKTVSPELLAFLWILIENESNIMVIGGTGAGKTSFLNGIAFFIPPASRIVSIEDTREINLLHENWLPSVARESTSIEQKGEIDLFTLLKESFRQRPDYVIVGEVRGKEAFVLFQGMSSGHPSFGTMHAEDVETMVRRLESPPIELSPSLVASLDAVCVIVQTKVMDKEVRRLKEVVEIVEVEKDKITLNKPFVWDPRNDMFYFKTDSKIFDKISMHRGISKEVLEKEFRLRSQLLLKMYRNKIFGFKEVNDIIAEYYKKPLEVLKRFNIQ